ncbi:dimethylamine monooxygenase subunit DmmA family protein [Aeromicrobium sp.]|uniref:dimethylamine monooxygenase subunit DmmA family protein n=1 Tax=Aeromicrobium sp. TaxID=1871063 RepID=UPI002FC865ED
MPKLEHTSVPLWAATGGRVAEPDHSGSSYLLVGVGADGRQAVATWVADLPGHIVGQVLGDDADSVRTELAVALTDARVGVRVRIAGPVSSCLTLRGVAVSVGAEDDELHLAPTQRDAVEVWCVHCNATSLADVAIGDVLPCGGCDRSLLVYHHVSRRTGQFLGFQVDAETRAGKMTEEIAS